MSNGDTRFVAPTTSRLRVMRDGHNIIRSARIPKPVVLVDTREREPFPLHANHPNWIAGERRVALKTGDYTVEGMESLLCLERKSLADLVACTVTYRRRFLAVCGRLARFPWKAILVEATLEDIKGGFEVVRHPVRRPSQCRLWPVGRDRSQVRHPRHLHVHGAGSCDGARRELALEALHLLVAGAARPRAGADRRGRVVISSSTESNPTRR